MRVGGDGLEPPTPCV